MSDPVTVVIDEDGTIEFVYTDELADLADVGDMAVCRASHVEPHPTRTGWLADMKPSGGPILGGNGEFDPDQPPVDTLPFWSRIEPFKTRAEALAAERAWLTANKGL